jgi:hypothetical protein
MRGKRLTWRFGLKEEMGRGDKKRIGMLAKPVQGKEGA